MLIYPWIKCPRPKNKNLELYWKKTSRKQHS